MSKARELREKCFMPATLTFSRNRLVIKIYFSTKLWEKNDFKRVWNAFYQKKKNISKKIQIPKMLPFLRKHSKCSLRLSSLSHIRYDWARWSLDEFQKCVSLPLNLHRSAAQKMLPKLDETIVIWPERDASMLAL